MKLLNLRCALYGRRSTDEHQMASMQVQSEEGERYIIAQGGTLEREHIFLDDAISRAEFKKRPGLLALLNAAKDKQFDAVVVRDESRLGGDTFRSGLVIQDLIECGVKLVYYYSDEFVTLDGAVDKFMIAARSFAAELEREKTAQRTHEHLLTKARRGLVVGGRVFGYDNVEVKNGDRRVHVEYKINEEQAAVVREIFERYADGSGLRTIAKDLNARRVAPPRAGKRGTGSWSTSVLWAMLRRERYRGILVWNTREKTYRGGTKVRITRDASEWIKADVPELRIIEDDLWFRAQAKTERVANPQQKKARGRPPKHLLSGLARCGECGGPLTVTNSKSSYESIKVYSCAYNRDRGKSVCTNTLRRPVDAVNQAVAEWISENILSEDLVVEVIAMVRDRLSARAKVTSSDVPKLEKDADRLRKEIDRLVAALASVDQKPDAIVRGIADRQEQLAALETRIRAAKTAPETVGVQLDQLEEEARKRIQSLQSLLDRNPDKGREVIRAVFEEPLKVTPIETAEGKRFWIEGSASIRQMLTTDRGCLNSASPTGPETLPNWEIEGFAVRIEVGGKGSMATA